MDQVTLLGIGVVTLAIIIGVGVTVLDKFGDSVGSPANTTTDYLSTQLGSTGLAGWVPAIIALVIGIAFIGMFAFGRSNRSF